MVSSYRSKSTQSIMVFFFFQAEDGIRDLYVTGVQTCALPICRHGTELKLDLSFLEENTEVLTPRKYELGQLNITARSEERRVGKECRSRRMTYHKKKKK